MMRRRLVLLAPAGLLAAGLAGTGAWWATRPATGVQIGGPFRLIDGDGHGVTDQTFRGKVMLVYFGYTHCPDACPTALQDMASAVDKLTPAQRAQVQIVFITVDPERDTPAVMKDYVSAFDASIVGLSGSPGAIAEAAREYRVYYARHDEGGSAYSMDHSTVIYAMDKRGRLASVFTQQTAPEQMAAELRKLVA